jgi:DNA-binding NarL/FixJ family response regulator
MKLTQEEIADKIETDEDFIVSTKHNNSLKKAIDDNPDGFENDKIAKFLNLSEKEVEEVYKEAIAKLQKLMGV